jgi:putative two-component system response regulator
MSGSDKGWSGLEGPEKANRLQSAKDSRVALVIAVRVLLVFCLFALLWGVGAGSLFDAAFGRDKNPALRDAANFVGFVVMTALMLFFALWSVTHELVSAKRRLKESERELVMRLGQASEWRDDETGDHTLRVGEYCAAIAHSYGWKPEDCDALRVAAMLHDIGKIGIPDFVMVKCGSLSPEERQLIQAHTLMGSDILADSEVPLLQMAQKIAASHHERWDGSGYPYSLKQREIPLEGRIAALADVFDALTSKRRYKDAWTFEQAVQEVKFLSGSHFDPDVVLAFESALPTLRQIYDKFQSTARMFNISRAA